MDRYKETRLWKKSLGSRADENSCEKLRATYEQFRRNVANLVGKISADLPNLTVHDVTHLDALWEIADLIAGDQYPLNPLEGFILGGAILLHDAALTFEAYTNGLAGIRDTVCWQDAYAYDTQQHPEKPDYERKEYADFVAVRRLHSERASALASASWTLPGNGNLYLIEDSTLRGQYGELIGQIAASHHWNVDDIINNLPNISMAAPGGYPREWTIDPIKIACLLRCADAAHIDNRRAPDFLYALTKRAGLSLNHWQAQNRIAQAIVNPSDPSVLQFSSTTAFPESEAPAWWVAYDALCLVEKELADCNNLLTNRQHTNPGTPPFKIKKVAGVDTPEEANKFIRTNGWLPTAAAIHVSDVQGLVRRLGGLQLYGADADPFKIALRELIQNSRDAIVARRCLEEKAGVEYRGAIRISVYQNGEDWKIEVNDDGVGMTKPVMTTALLDFGFSFWSSDHVHQEFPGLRSKRFKPIGRFGIGFYSVFMAARDVRIASRHYKHGHEKVHTLLFPNGLSLRPILKVGEPDFGSQMSTRVVLTLLPNIINQDGTINFPYQEPTKGQQVLKPVAIPEYIAHLVPGLDVDIYFQDKLIHKNIENIITDGTAKSEWLHSLQPPTFDDNPVQSLSGELSANLRPLYEEGRLCGFAAVNSVGTDVMQVSAATVGGFSTSALGSILGYLEYEATGAARKISEKPSVSPRVLREWGEEQVQLLLRSETPRHRLAVAGQSLIRMGLFIKESLYYSLGQLCGGYMRGDYLSLDELIEVMKSRPIIAYAWQHHPSISLRMLSFDQTCLQSLINDSAKASVLLPFGSGNISLVHGDLIPPNDLTFVGVIKHALDGSNYNLRQFRKILPGTGQFGGKLEEWTYTVSRGA